MSCIASAVSSRIASGATWRKVRPPASNVDTPSVVTSRYGVSSRADRAAGRSSGTRDRSDSERGGSGTHGCTIVVLRRREIVDRRPCHTASVTTAPRKGTRVRPAPTLEEVAARAGVSRATASRVLRGDAKVSDHAREAVHAAAQAISYVPNLAARTLVTGRSDSIAFLVEETEERMFADPFFLGMLRSAQEAVAVAGTAAGLHRGEQGRGPAAFPGLRRRRPRRRGAAALAARSGPAPAAARGARRARPSSAGGPSAGGVGCGTSTRTTSAVAGSRPTTSSSPVAGTSRR